MERAQTTIQNKTRRNIRRVPCRIGPIACPTSRRGCRWSPQADGVR